MSSNWVKKSKFKICSVYEYSFKENTILQNYEYYEEFIFHQFSSNGLVKEVL